MKEKSDGQKRDGEKGEGVMEREKKEGWKERQQTTTTTTKPRALNLSNQALHCPL